MPTNDPYWNDFREDAVAFRAQQWAFKQFRSAPALFTRDGRYARRYLGEPYDPTECEVRETAWDHEHCYFCTLKIDDGEDEELKAGYVSGAIWLCPNCYHRIVEAGEDPEDVIMGSG